MTPGYSLINNGTVDHLPPKPPARNIPKRFLLIGIVSLVVLTSLALLLASSKKQYGAPSARAPLPTGFIGSSPSQTLFSQITKQPSVFIPTYTTAYVQNSQVYLYDGKTKKEELLKDSSDQEITYNPVVDSGFTFSASGQYLLWQNTRNETITIVDIASSHLTVLPNKNILAGVVSDTRDQIALLDTIDGTTEILDIPTQKVLTTVNLHAFPLAFSPDNSMLLIRRVSTTGPKKPIFYVFYLAEAKEEKLYTTDSLTFLPIPVWLPDNSGFIVYEVDRLVFVPVDKNKPPATLITDRGVITTYSPVNKNFFQLIAFTQEDKQTLIFLNVKTGEAKIMAALPNFDTTKETLRLGIIDAQTFWYSRSDKNAKEFSVSSFKTDDGQSEEILNDVNRFAFLR